MEVRFEHGQEFNVKIIGRLDTVTSAQFDQAIKSETITESKVVLDFSEVEYISSAGLRVLLALKRELDDAGKEMEIHHINAVVREIFGVTGFINVLTVK
jgi:anti-anti-sigma factor